MAKDEEERSPLDDLVDLLVYAPVGLIYEYDKVMPRLVKRGKSQVQLMRALGKVAVKRGRGDSMVGLADSVGTIVARRVTELGEAIGLAPTDDIDEPTDQPPSPAPPPPTAADRIAPQLASDADIQAPPEISDPAAVEAETTELALPIAGYDDLTAREIVKLLDDDLEPSQLARLRAHEEATRARKTVLGKLDRLGA